MVANTRFSFLLPSVTSKQLERQGSFTKHIVAAPAFHICIVEKNNSSVCCHLVKLSKTTSKEME